eukprot:gene21353-24225_t
MAQAGLKSMLGGFIVLMHLTMQTITVPAGAISMSATLYGAAGGDSIPGPPPGSVGGKGGMIAATIPVAPGQLFYLYVGGAAIKGAAGYNGGGQGYYDYAGGGGGATDLRMNTDSLYSRVLVAGGGGGGNGNCGGGYPGGAGGYPSGFAGPPCSNYFPGPGGTQYNGGSTSDQYCFSNNFGGFGYGGPSCLNQGSSYGGAGGGGWYGGGGSYGSPGGGGSSYSAYAVT